MELSAQQALKQKQQNAPIADAEVNSEIMCGVRISCLGAASRAQIGCGRRVEDNSFGAHKM
eukprot:1199783-Amphidinium_carterae.1